MFNMFYNFFHMTKKSVRKESIIKIDDHLINTDHYSLDDDDRVLGTCCITLFSTLL